MALCNWSTAAYSRDAIRGYHAWPRRSPRAFCAHCRTPEADRVPLGARHLAHQRRQARDRRIGATAGYDAPHMSDDESVDERILQALGIDFRRVGSLIGGKRWMAGERMVDIWGVERAWSGEYWDIVYSPKGCHRNDLDNYPWRTQRDCCQLPSSSMVSARALIADTDVVVVAEHPVYGVFELGCWMCGTMTCSGVWRAISPL